MAASVQELMAVSYRTSWFIHKGELCSALRMLQSEMENRMKKSKKHVIKLRGKMRAYLNVSFLLGILLVIFNIWIYTIDKRAGVVLSSFVAFYLVIILCMLYMNKPEIVSELVSFATQYGQIQKELLRELDVPYVITDEKGKIICNIWSIRCWKRYNCK